MSISQGPGGPCPPEYLRHCSSVSSDNSCKLHTRQDWRHQQSFASSKRIILGVRVVSPLPFRLGPLTFLQGGPVWSIDREWVRRSCSPLFAAPTTRMGCLLVLNSVTSTPQWIRQPKAAWGGAIDFCQHLCCPSHCQSPIPRRRASRAGLV